MFSKKVEQNFVTEINQEPVDMEALNSAPVLKGYIVQKRRYSLEAGKGKLHNNRKIMTVNNLENETIKKRRQIIDYKILSGIMKKKVY